MKIFPRFVCATLGCVAQPVLAAAPLPDQAEAFATPNVVIKRGTPTFVLGTVGDERSRRAVAAQVDALRGMLFPRAVVMRDDAINVTKGPGAWPSNPVLYGGPQVNSLLARLAPSLPFAMQRGKLVLGSEVFEGDEYRLITVIPARPADASGPGYPEFLLYAGTGSPGVAEINAVSHGGEPILVADTFGRLLSGQWRRLPNGGLEPVFPKPRARRIAWRTTEQTLVSATGQRSQVRINFPEQIAPASDDDQVGAACVRGLAQASRRLEIATPTAVTVYVYPDRGSKRSLTGNAGDGHADVLSHAVHVVRSDSSANGGLERALAHEGTHVLTYEAWGAAGTPLLGEGIAVWASGTYGGVPLEAWPGRLSGEMPPLADLLGAQFRRLPEPAAYPLAGLLVDVAVKKVGVAGVRDHLYGATASTWAEACRAAGTSAPELEQALRDRLMAARSTP